MKQHLSQHEKIKTNDKIKEYKSSLEEVKAGIVNYELELAREKLRADTNHERSQNLVNELIAVRQQIAALQKDNKILTQEIERLRKSSH
ncbi:hypothetical protein AGDE_02605 [Angomonas deanei]|nr:hypothetical protein AGDE_02605 [Angomonas deanei]|eukprot:EPY41320.1 hypothetical protein AGDE_02605 [Angomonas deanei]